MNFHVSTKPMLRKLSIALNMSSNDYALQLITITFYWWDDLKKFKLFPLLELGILIVRKPEGIMIEQEHYTKDDIAWRTFGLHIYCLCLWYVGLIARFGF